MLKNNKGFMLAEAVITSTIVLTTLISFYTAFNKLYSEYEIRSRYYNIDGIYASKNMITHLMRNDNSTTNLNTILGANFKNNNYIYLIKNETCNQSIIDQCSNSDTIEYAYINSLISKYKINNMILMEWSKNIILDGNNSIIKNDPNINETFKEYLKNYVAKYYDFENNTEYNYLLITEYKKENGTKEEYNYSSISMR